MLSPVPGAEHRTGRGAARPARPARRPGAARGRGRTRAGAGPAGRPRWPASSSRCRRRRPGRSPGPPPVGQQAGQPVVRQQHPLDARGARRLVLGQPAQLGHGEAGHRHRADRRPPTRSGPPSSATSVGGGAGRAGVVPEQGRPDDGAGGVQGDHAVLLAADRRSPRRRRAARPRSPSRTPRAHTAGSTSVRVRVRRGAGPQHRAGLRVADDDLRGLGRAVDAGDRCAHARILSSTLGRGGPTRPGPRPAGRRCTPVRPRLRRVPARSGPPPWPAPAGRPGRRRGRRRAASSGRPGRAPGGRRPGRRRRTAAGGAG